jgi:hypothetical protein
MLGCGACGSDRRAAAEHALDAKYFMLHVMPPHDPKMHLYQCGD